MSAEQSKEVDPREPHPQAKLWVPAVISLIALGLTIDQLSGQRDALDQQSEQLETQRQQLDTQRDAVNAQRQALKDAEARWLAEGPLLESVMNIAVPDNEGLQRVGTLVENLSTTNGSMYSSLWLSQADYDVFDSFYISLTVTNLGRGAGLISGVYGSLDRTELVKSPDPSKGIVERSERDALSLRIKECETDSGFVPCDFPLRVDALGAVSMRIDITDYLEHAFGCPEDRPGQITVKVSTPKDRVVLEDELTVSNFKECDNPVPLVIAEPL